MAHDTEPTIFVEGEETGDFLRDSDIIPSMTFAIDMFSYNEIKMKFGAEELVEKIA